MPVRDQSGERSSEYHSAQAEHQWIHAAGIEEEYAEQRRQRDPLHRAQRREPAWQHGLAVSRREQWVLLGAGPGFRGLQVRRVESFRRPEQSGLGQPYLPLTSNAIDIWLYGANTTSQIGGIDPGSRNIIAGANGSDSNYGGRGIALPNYGSASSTGNSIVGNLIGLDYQESMSGGNGVGVQIETAGNRVLNNIIGNSNNGIQVRGVSASGNLIQNNRIGLTEPFCAPALPPLDACIWFDGTSTPNQAGIYFWQGAHDNRVRGNTITNNTLFGIELINAGTY
ncbi:MAG: hypothetical protein E6K53_17210, partial [Gammaproteobacteria bacterium]